MCAHGQVVRQAPQAGTGWCTVAWVLVWGLVMLLSGIEADEGRSREGKRLLCHPLYLLFHSSNNSLVGCGYRLSANQMWQKLPEVGV